MKKVIDLEIKRMFTAFQSPISVDKEEKRVFSDNVMQYYCDFCNQQFSTIWNIRANVFNPWVARGNFVRCCYCGTVHESKVATAKAGIYIPYRVRFRLTLYKKKIRLKLDYKSMSFVKHSTFKVKGCTGFEEFCFDVANRKATFHQKIKHLDTESEYATCPITDFYAKSICEESALRFFTTACLANKTHRKEFVQLLRFLREAVEQRMISEHGISLGSTYVNAGGHPYGMFLVPIINLARRMENPEQANFKSQGSVHGKVERLYKSNEKEDCEWINKIYDLVAGGMEENKAVLYSAGLPQTDSLERIIVNDYRHVFNLKRAYDLVENYDLFLRLHEATKLTSDKIHFLKVIKKIYGEDSMVRFAEKEEEYNLKDCSHLHELLTEENKFKFENTSMRLREIHDWLVLEHLKQNHVNEMLNVPEHVIRRLSMQKDRMKFFVPTESLQLLETGKHMHNCVGSYSGRVKSGNTYIVVVTNDEGHYIACLRIKEDVLVEAKIGRNKQVKVNKGVNQMVLDWAKERNIAIKTEDINTIVNFPQKDMAI